MAHPVYEFADRITDEYAALKPLDATDHGVAGYDDRLDDLSPDGVAATEDAYSSWLGELSSFPDAAGYWEELAVRTLTERLELKRHHNAESFRDLNNIASPVQDLAEFYEAMDRETETGWAHIISRLSGVGDALAGYQATLDVGRSKGMVAARRQAEAVLRQARELAGSSSGYLTLVDSYTRAGEPGGRTADLATAIDTARVAFGSFADYLETAYLAAAAIEDGIGQDRYGPSVRYFLGDTIDFAETYEWAWSEIARLRAEMEQAADQISAGATISEAVAIAAADPARVSRDREHFVEVMTDLQRQALADLDGTAFHIPQQGSEVTVNISPPGATLGAHYLSPSEDFSRPGSVWYSLDESEHQIPFFSQISTNYHEGFPGHHLQIVYQMAKAADKLTRFHKSLVWYSGSGEGWALYSERLMLELGYFDRPEYVLNTHAESMLRACRVVVDIGSHMGYAIPEGQPFHPGEGWTFETATEMLEGYALQHPAYAASEVTRYLGWPGQAIAYKVGEREILRMRETMRKRQGDEFDLIDFHDRILTPGAIGLAHLRDLVLG